ncbi:amino acid adenylation domain-containing protein [Nonomuraea fuscirosea]|uniref:Amino acid adenylation domain-containing protein n=1 Tax=Nonomuraea fuscirosea TaxID=1291556 RepID=A0A2T0MQB6_9ACTN|nr:non-ribosomal peptide synthetase [Nonomuraea fuscirosea]PRX60349.1 amino acid adenylation domain-containing protein [Nonomuraea fuscirosea]
MSGETAPLGEELLSMLAALSPERRQLLSMKLTQASRDDRPIPRLPRRPGENALPAAHGQQRLHFLHRLDPDSAAYLVPAALRLRGTVVPDVLRASLDALVARHEVLRTGFRYDAVEGVVQVVRAAQDIETVLICGEAPPDRIDHLVTEFARRPFDLAEPPLLRAALWRVREPGESYVLAVCAHHIVVDGWSLRILVEELAELYRAGVAGRSPNLPELTIQYADHAAWQREQLDGASLAGHLEYWRRELLAAPPVELPATRPRPKTWSFAGDGVAFHLPPDLTVRLRDVGRAEDATLFLVLLTGLAVVLHRWTGQSDLLVGTPVAGRSRPEVERLVGFFVNTLPLRVRLVPEETFSGLLRKVRAGYLEATAHQEVPFELIVRESGADRRGERSPLIQVLLALDTARPAGLDLPGIEAELVDLAPAGAPLDLSVSLAPTADGGLSGWVIYATDLFDRQAAERFSRHLRTLFESVARDVAAAVPALPSMPDAERRWLSERGRASGDPTPDSVLDLFDAQVLTSPDAVAAVCDVSGEAVSYRQLDERAERLAQWLRDRGVGNEDRVGVCLDRGLDLVVALLGVLKSGGTYLPLDPGLPGSRLHWLALDTRPVLTLCSDAYADRIPGETARIPDAVARGGSGARSATPDPRGAAYVVHTSGSTGTPKGVVVPHQALANRIRRMGADLGYSAGDVVLFKTPICFDPSIAAVLTPLTTGGTIVIAAPGRHGDPAYLRAIIERHGVTACDFVPSMLRAVLADQDAASALRSLRVIPCGGEELAPDLAEQALRLLPRAQLYNLYGPTEATIDVSFHRVTAPVQAPPPIGAPIGGNELYVLDATGALAPIGVPGELHIGGMQLARGYLGRPGLTADRFVPHPFRPGQRLYRTGDRVWWRPEGVLAYLGRLDRQVKINGHRVEPAEVEAALRAHPEVVEAAAIPRAGARGEPRLAAYVTPPVDPGSLRAHLAERLPAAWIPSFFTGLDALPHNASGKVDHARLPEPVPAGLGPSVPPVDALEEVLAAVWAEALAVDGVGRDDDFFSLGGHSLLATTIAAQLGDLFRFEPPLRFFVETPTVAGLAALMREQGEQHGIDADRVAELIAQVEAMSDDEVEGELLR